MTHTRCLHWWFAIVAFALLPTMNGATAPDSISGKVYRDDYLNSGVRTSSESTIIFRADGRFVYLRYSVGNANFLPAPYRTFLYPAPGDGTYTYTRTSENGADVKFSFDGGQQDTLHWNFISPTSGTFSRDVPTPPQGRFTFADLDSSIPAANISMRGRVAAGQPLIVGFVVPGIPSTNFPILQSNAWTSFAPGQHPRDLLIRVVGSSLARLGVNGVWTDADFSIFRGAVPADLTQAHYPDWSEIPSGGRDATSAFNKIFGYVGAFSLQVGSKDAASVVRLPPGPYTVVVGGRDGDSGGEVLVELYWLP